jgi:response regulator of citrate/malate metabolism
MTMDGKTVSVSGEGVFNPLRIFLVEDSAAVRNFIIENVADIDGIFLMGFSDTENGALEKLHGQMCDVLILDIELKQGNGMSLLRTLLKNDLQPDMLKIIFSNNVSDVYRRIGEQYGAHFFFDKASDFLQLRSLLEKLGAGVSLV